MTEIDLNISYASGARRFGSLFFFARPGKDNDLGALPEILFQGSSMIYSMSFFKNRKENNIEAHDPNGDDLFTVEDASATTAVEGVPLGGMGAARTDGSTPRQDPSFPSSGKSRPFPPS